MHLSIGVYSKSKMLKINYRSAFVRHYLLTQRHNSEPRQYIDLNRYIDRLYKRMAGRFLPGYFDGDVVCFLPLILLDELISGIVFLSSRPVILSAVSYSFYNLITFTNDGTIMRSRYTDDLQMRLFYIIIKNLKITAGNIRITDEGALELLFPKALPCEYVLFAPKQFLQLN